LCLDITSQLEKVQLKSNYRLPDSQREFERHKLERKTKDIKKKFARFLTDLLQHMITLQDSGAVDFSVIRAKLIMYDRSLKKTLSSCKSFPALFEVITSPKHSSFLDYDLVKLLIDDVSEKIANNFTRYKQDLQKFLEDRMAVETTEEGERTYTVTIDESILKEIPDWNHLHNRIKLLLGHKGLKLRRLEDLSHAASTSTSASGQQIAASQNSSVEMLQNDSVAESKGYFSVTTNTQSGSPVPTPRKNTASMLHPGEELISSGNSHNSYNNNTGERRCTYS
jgi:hypothetical protein